MTSPTVMVADASALGVPVDRSAGEWTMIMRGANFVVAVLDTEAGAVLERVDHPDESMLFLATTSARVTAGGKTIDAEAESLVILPPGTSCIETLEKGLLVRIFSTMAPDLAELAENASAYANGIGNCAPLTAWPEPVDGFQLRHYRLADYPNMEGSDLRIFRCTNLMINFLRRRTAPRELDKLSPHSHVDFEQGSLTVEGRFIHHIRYPWTADLTKWREDKHLEVGSPSITIIPCEVIHTSRNVDPNAWLIDIFAPPRLDFSRMPDVVKNAADYPMPEAVMTG